MVAEMTNWVEELANKKLHNTIDCDCDSKSNCHHRGLEKSIEETNKLMPEVRESMKKDFLSLNEVERQKEIESVKQKIQKEENDFGKEMWVFTLKEYYIFLIEEIGECFKKV